MTDALRERVRSAVAAVDDPEYPGISITDLGLVEALDVTPTATWWSASYPPSPDARRSR